MGRLTTFSNGGFDVVLIAQVIVQAEGLPPTAVEANPGVPLSQMPLAPGMVWKVRVDRQNPKHLKFLSDQAEADAQVAAGRAEAEQIAAKLRGEGPPPPSPPTS
jgi:hypothetical protein